MLPIINPSVSISIGEVTRCVLMKFGLVAPLTFNARQNFDHALAVPCALYQPNRYSGRKVAVHGTSKTRSRVAICAMTKGATPLYMSI